MRKWLSWFLAAVLCLSLLPRAAASEGLPFRDGDQVVIYTPEKGKALSSEKSGNNHNSATVTVTTEGLTGYGETEVWTVEMNDDGSFRLLTEGQILSMAAQYSYLHFDEVHDSWTLEAAGDGTWYVKNTGREQYLCMNASRSRWTTCADVDDAVTALAFYVLPREEETPETTAPSEPEQEGYRFYFGQLHAHTDLSDGTGTVEEAFSHAANVEGLDFFAVTDHSQSFDNAEQASLNVDASAVSQEWARGKAAAEAVTNDSFVGIFGFEMTWNQGQGHMNTFNTPGFLSRKLAEYESYAQGMENYYAALLEAEGSISQFNHPGFQYGDFKDFSGFSPELDQRITLIELGDSTVWYDRALTLGWHLAPTNNQNNHEGQWGDESPVRTVALAEALTEESLYDAMANYRIYATEDRDLEILYTLNGNIMGSEIPLSQAGDTAAVSAELYDPTDDAIGMVEVVTEGGTVLGSCTLTSARGRAEFTLPANRKYYYLRITQPDGDMAVTAPVWLDAQADMGISRLETGTEVTTAGEAQTFTVELYNNEKDPFQVTSVTLTAEETVYTDTSVSDLDAFGTASCTFSHTFREDGVYTVTATVEGSCNGEVRRSTKTLRVIAMPPPLVDDVIIDGTHGNTESLQNILALAAGQDVDMRTETGEITAETLKTCRLLVIPAPAENFEDSFVSAVADFVEQGGSVILCGGLDAAPRLSHLLDALGATARFLDGEVRDEVNNGGQPQLIYTTVFAESPWLVGITDGQTFGQEWGCAIDPGAGQWLVTGFDTAGSPVLLAVEETAQGGQLFLSGCTFLSDAYVDDNEDSLWALPSANQTIMENILGILRSSQETIPIADLRTAEVGRIYLTEGLITAGTANPNTTFENTIYLQDDTGGIAALGYSTHGLALGTRVRILGSLGRVEGNPTLEILRMEKLNLETVIQPEAAETSVSYAQKGGQLLWVEGTVTDRVSEGSAVSRFTLTDENGAAIVVLVEDYIFSGSRGVNELTRIVKNGSAVQAVGLLHLAEGQTVIRVRDCDEVTLLAGETEPEDTLPTNSTEDDEDATDPTQPGTGLNPDTGDGVGLYVLLMATALVGMMVLAGKRKKVT